MEGNLSLSRAVAIAMAMAMAMAMEMAMEMEMEMAMATEMNRELYIVKIFLVICRRLLCKKQYLTLYAIILHSEKPVGSCTVKQTSF